jgi:hypothetical protein
MITVLEPRPVRTVTWSIPNLLDASPVRPSQDVQSGRTVARDHRCAATLPNSQRTRCIKATVVDSSQTEDTSRMQPPTWIGWSR